MPAGAIPGGGIHQVGAVPTGDASTRPVGPISARPTAGPRNYGWTFAATDTGILYESNGVTWIAIADLGGGGGGGGGTWGTITGTLSDQTDLQDALDDKANTADLGSAAFAATGDFDPAGAAAAVTKTSIGLGNVDNTSDATKNAASVTLTNKTLTSPVVNSPTGIVKGDVGLGSVNNTSNATERAAVATLTNKTLTSPVINSPTGITKSDVGLGSVTNDQQVKEATATTKGDIFARSSTAVVRVAVGTNDLPLVADSSATPGVSYKALPVAGGGTGATTALSARVNLGAAQETIPTAVKTTNYSAAAGDYVPVDTTSGNVQITLPTAPADGTRIDVKHVIRGGVNVVTIVTGGSDVFNRAGGVTSASLTLSSQAYSMKYKSSTAIWYLESNVPLGSTDSRYGIDGWYADVGRTWVYGSATVLAVPGDATAYMKPGFTKVSYNDGAVDYGDVFLAPAPAAAVTGCTTSVSADTVGKTSHGLANGTPVTITGLVNTTGITNGTTYWVVSTAANTFQLALTIGGAAINLTGADDGAVVTATPATKVTLIANDDYSIANAALSAPRYSFNESPAGFPGEFRWTPTWTGVTVGSGTYNYRHFSVSKGVVKCRLKFVLGAGSSVSGAVAISTPCDSHSDYTDTLGEGLMGVCTLRDAAVASYYATPLWASTTTVGVRVVLVTGTYSQQLAIGLAVPFATNWGTSDFFVWTFEYKMAGVL